MRAGFFALSLLVATVTAPVAMAAGQSAGAPLAPHDAFQCAQCHSASVSQMPQTKDCLGCHGSESAVAERTAKLSPNPHDSHRGSVDCTECHRAHDKQNILMCNDCHAFHTTDGFHIRDRK